jgi:hypothetical protein
MGDEILYQSTNVVCPQKKIISCIFKISGALIVFSLSHMKYRSAYYPHALNEILPKYWHNIKKNLRSFLSILERMQ